MNTINIALYGCKEPLKIAEEFIVFPSDFTIKVGAHGMSQVNRFTGQTPYPFSIAEHTVNLLTLVRSRVFTFRALNKAILLHDMPEALGINDLNTHVKRELAPDVRKVEQRLNVALWSMYGDTEYSWEEMENLLKPFDTEIGGIEKEFIFGNGVRSRFTPEYLRPTDAQWVWMHKWDEVYQGERE